MKILEFISTWILIQNLKNKLQKTHHTAQNVLSKLGSNLLATFTFFSTLNATQLIY